MTTEEARDILDEEWTKTVSQRVSTALIIAGLALERQIPRKPVIKLHENRVPSEQKEPYCPYCDEWIGRHGYKEFHCNNCGQAIDWSDE